VRPPNGKIRIFQVGHSNETQTFAIDKHGAITGLYFVGFRTIHAFLRKP